MGTVLSIGDVDYSILKIHLISQIPSKKIPIIVYEKNGILYSANMGLVA